MPSMSAPNPRRTVKNRDSGTDSGTDSRIESFTELNPAHLGDRIAGQPLSIEETKLKQESNSLKINGLLNKITGFDSDSNRLADFKPPPNPALTKTPIQHQTQPNQPNRMTAENPLVPVPHHQPPKTQNQAQTFFRPFSKPGENEFSNYLDAHNNRISYTREPKDTPYYAKKDDRMNYIVHMLEEMQKEKTNHVTEEFVLYTMLGVFIIYIVDGFARIGTKYVR
jgi:hypothetical protein